MEIVELSTVEVIAQDTFVSTATEETLCRVLASPRLNAPEELSLYHAVVAWGQEQSRAAEQAEGSRPLAEVVAKPMAHVRFGLILGPLVKRTCARSEASLG